MFKQKKIITLLVAFLCILYGFPTIALAGFTIGEQCSNTSDLPTSQCTSGECESSDVKLDNDAFCVCDEDAQCEAEAKTLNLTLEPGETWECVDGEAASFDLDFCQSNKGKKIYPVSKEKAAELEKKEVDAKAAAAAASPAAPSAPAKAPVSYETVPPKISVPIPGLPEFKSETIKAGEIVSIPWLTQYIVAIYKYAIIIGSIIAVITLMFGGLKYLIGGAYAEAASGAKKMMLGAVAGLVVLLASNLILQMINPKLTKLSSLTLETVPPEEAIIEGEFDGQPSGNFSAITGTGASGNLPAYKQTDKKWACFPFTGNECSYQTKYNGKALACGISGYAINFPGVTTSPEVGIFACKFKNDTYKGMNYCEWLEQTYHISSMCTNANMKNSAWCENNPYGKNNFVEYCKKVSAKSGGKEVNLNTLQSSGCGTTSAAMVFSFYGVATTPPELAKWAQENGIRAPSIGGDQPQTCCGLDKLGITAAAKARGMSVQSWWKPKKNEPEITNLLNKGIPIVFRVKGASDGKPDCKFTKGGHFMVLKDFNGSTYTVHNPSGPGEGGVQTATPEDIWDNCSVQEFIYIYPEGQKGQLPSLNTASDSDPPGASTTVGNCQEPDLSTYDNTTGCLSNTRKCTPKDIKEVAEKFGKTHIVTPPNSCARFSSRILRNAGCAIPGGGGIGTLKPQLQKLGWKGLIVKGEPVQKYYSQMPAGMLFTCNTGALQHVSISAGKGIDVESANPFSACQNVGCPKDSKQTCGTTNQDIINKCKKNGFIPKLNAIEGGPKGCTSSDPNQCINMTTADRIKGVTAVFFPPLDLANESTGCCVSDLITASRNITVSGIRTSQKTCEEGLYGKWSPGNSCPIPKDPVEIGVELKAANICNNW